MAEKEDAEEKPSGCSTEVWTSSIRFDSFACRLLCLFRSRSSQALALMSRLLCIRSLGSLFSLFFFFFFLLYFSSSSFFFLSHILIFQFISLFSSLLLLPQHLVE